MRNVLITGSSHGIGAAAVIAFAKLGCNVGINYAKSKGKDIIIIDIRSFE